MDSASSPDNDHAAEQPIPEVLVERANSVDNAEQSAVAGAIPKTPGKRLGRAYRPNNRATIIGLTAVVFFLAINGIVIAIIIRSQSHAQDTTPQGQVSVSQAVLSKIGVNQGTIGDPGIQLTISPNTEFKGQVIVGGDISVAGKLHLNSVLIASDATLTKLTVGDATANTLTVSNTGTFAILNVQKQLTVLGTTQLQGVVTVTQLFTVNNNANIAGGLSVGGGISTAAITARSITTTSTLTISGHIITVGLAPSLGSGLSALGSNGTASISGNDAAGTVAVNIGTGAIAGFLASVTFRTPYPSTPRVVIGPVGDVGSFYISRNNTGFSIFVHGGLAPGGYAFDYIVEQ
jgi:cytoskeletal protein CcmA (bactofilin family)